jgi:hypothetical protein
MDRNEFAGRVAFAVGTGRCGTHFLYRVFTAEPSVASSHERGRFNEAFHRYCRWYDLPVDEEGFFVLKAAEIKADLRQKKSLSFEASAYLSLSIQPLFERFGARFVLMVRRPDEVVNSYWSKGWYAQPYVQSDPSLALGFQPLRPHNYFSRIAPKDGDFRTWNALTRVGKIAWFWNVLNSAVLDQFATLLPAQTKVVRLEDLTYQVYGEIAAFFGITTTLGGSGYAAIERARPGTRGRTRILAEWSAEEIDQFETHVRPTAERLGYEYRVAELLRVEGSLLPDRERRRTAEGLRRTVGGMQRRMRGIWRRLTNMRTGAS